MPAWRITLPLHVIATSLFVPGRRDFEIVSKFCALFVQTLMLTLFLTSGFHFNEAINRPHQLSPTIVTYSLRDNKFGLRRKLSKWNLVLIG
mmetsp:Transcript_13140/g.31963  ORF Transcript_13140/g.31963 Transcript_13140/m.31963 type:complete len:91 (+) Transcript_13140:152-424(+)